ncbi:uncharacterized protein LOC119092377 [Pollicipes pollicipes]|uniref:uncharacterized protein LOC119092377 n=1 Tax=Pollicipes pollicipes TaxID=41117 RepID=UPI0018855265|nr:uncharacterized protein LOC119092377 [Pollicipes pollicipes]
MVFGPSVLSLLALGCIQISAARKSHRHTFGSMIRQYVAQKALRLAARYMRRRFDNDTKRFMQCQEETLMERVKASRDTPYGRDHGFADIHNLAEFRVAHPPTEYAHYADYVQRLADGEPNVLFTDKLRSLACTSGTSGGSKLMPVSQGLVLNLVGGVLVLWERQLAAFPGAGRLQRQMRPFVAPRWRYSSGGLPIGPASVAPPGQRDGREHTQFLYSAPPEVNQIGSEADAVYVHLLFGLLDQQLGAIEANFASFVYAVFAALERDCALYAATEGLLGVNLWPERQPPGYVLHPRAMLFEFVETSGDAKTEYQC